MDVAWNQVRLAGLPPDEKMRLTNEVEILKELDHKNIIKLHHYWINQDDDSEVSVNFITEACTQTLKKYAAKLGKKNLDLRAVKSWCRQILRGLDYLHSHQPPIVHRDLKCDNIFVNQNQGEVKIGDLGLAAALENLRTKSVIGTPEFMAPELYDEDYNEYVDIYSFGMCIVELVTQECPYSECGGNPGKIYKKVSNNIAPEALDKIVDPSLRSFIFKCIAPMGKRLSAKELMEDPFLDKVASKPKEKKATVEEEPDMPRPGGTEQFVKNSSKPATDSAAVSESGTDVDASADRTEGDVMGDGHGGGDSSGGLGSRGGTVHGSEVDDTFEGGSSRPASEKGASSRPGSVAGGDEGVEGELPSPPGLSPNRRPSYAEAASKSSKLFMKDAESDGQTSSKDTDLDVEYHSSAELEVETERGGAEGGGAAATAAQRPKSRLAKSSSQSMLSQMTSVFPSHVSPACSDDDRALSEGRGTTTANAAEPSEVSSGDVKIEGSGNGAEEAGEGPDRRQGGSLDFRVKGRVLEDKTLRLRLRIGDASGHTRTVEFPFNTDTDSAYSVASEMVEELELAQSDVRTIMTEIENEVQYLKEGVVSETNTEVAGGSMSVSAQQDQPSMQAQSPQVQVQAPAQQQEAPAQQQHPPPAQQQRVPRSSAETPGVPQGGSSALPPLPRHSQSTSPTRSTSPPAHVTQDPAVIASEMRRSQSVDPLLDAHGGAALGKSSSLGTSPSLSPRTAKENALHAPVPQRTGPTGLAVGGTGYAQHSQVAATTVQGAGGAGVQTMPPMDHAHAHFQQHHPHHLHHRGTHHGNGTGNNSRASSVVSDDVDGASGAADISDDVAENEMEQLLAMQQREIEEMQRRHNQEREAMQRRKMAAQSSSKSQLGGLGLGSMSSMGHGSTSSISSMTSQHGHDAHHMSNGTDGRGMQQHHLQAHHLHHPPSKPPVATKPQHVQGPPRPGSTPPSSPGAHLQQHQPQYHAHQSQQVMQQNHQTQHFVDYHHQQQQHHVQQQQQQQPGHGYMHPAFSSAQLGQMDQQSTQQQLMYQQQSVHNGHQVSGGGSGYVHPGLNSAAVGGSTQQQQQQQQAGQMYVGNGASQAQHHQPMQQAQQAQSQAQHQHQHQHAAALQQLTGERGQPISRSGSTGSVTSHQGGVGAAAGGGAVGGGGVHGTAAGGNGSGHNSDDGESRKPSKEDKAAKQQAAKEKLKMMEASALLNLNGLGGGGSVKERKGSEGEIIKAANGGGEGIKSMAIKQSAAPTASAPGTGGLVSSVMDHTTNPQAYAGGVPSDANMVVAYNGDTQHPQKQ